MSSASKIEWTEATWNPIVGCSIVSPGCTNCYAMKMAARIERMGSAPHYAGLTKTVNGKAVWTGKMALAPVKILLEPLQRKLEYMALLMNWGWPGAGGLASFWAKYPPARIYLMRWKIDFTGQGAPPMLNAWFVFDRNWSGEPVLRMLDRKDARQGELFGKSEEDAA